MLKLLFHPAVYLMNRLSYPAKFALVMALFAVPLGMTSVQSIVSMSSEISATEQRLEGIRQLKLFAGLIPITERIRDLSVTRRMGNDDDIAESYNRNRTDALNYLDQMLHNSKLTGNPLLLLLLQNLQRQVESMRVSTGSEGDNVELIFTSTNRLVDEVYDLQQRIANEFGITSDTDWLTGQLITILLDEFKAPQDALGRTRAYGVFYLNKAFMTSSGIGMLDATYQQLSVAGNRLQQRFVLLVSTNNSFKSNFPLDVAALDSLREAQLLLEEQLLLDDELSMPWEEYYEAVTGAINRLDILRDRIVDIVIQNYTERLQQQKMQWFQHLAGIGCLVLVSVYLFGGFYFSVRRTLDSLILGARNVARGALTDRVTIESRDEMLELADVMDTMRMQLYERQQQLLDMTITDGLTGIRNRKFFNDEIAQRLAVAQRKQEPLVLLLIDIDYFKRLNDAYGHPFGDLCLKEVAQSIRALLKRPDDSVARYGGEEFAAILPDTDILGGTQMAERICRSIRAILMNANGENVQMSVSIGVASSCQSFGRSEEQLIKAVDGALYQAKAQGRNQWVLAQEEMIEVPVSNA